LTLFEIVKTAQEIKGKNVGNGNLRIKDNVEIGDGDIATECHDDASNDSRKKADANEDEKNKKIFAGAFEERTRIDTKLELGLASYKAFVGSSVV
jgi:hypothetical protein